MYYAKSVEAVSPVWFKSKTIRGFHDLFDRKSEIIVTDKHPDLVETGKHYTIKVYKVVRSEDNKESSLEINKLVNRRWA